MSADKSTNQNPVGEANFKPAAVSKVKTKAPTEHRISPNSLANLKHEKGFTGNPGGRPKTKLLREHVLELFNKSPQTCVKRLYKERIDLFFAYAFGKPVETVALQNPDGTALKTQVVLALAQAHVRGEITLDPARQ